MAVTIPAPAQRDGIGQALADTLGIDVFDVTLVGDDLNVDVDESREPEARTFVDGYTPPPPPPDPDDEFRAAVEAATSIADLKAALLGTSGPGAEPRRP